MTMKERELKRLPLLIGLGVVIGTVLSEIGLSLFR
jgi:hypothetical protein